MENECDRLPPNHRPPPPRPLGATAAGAQGKPRLRESARPQDGHRPPPPARRPLMSSELERPPRLQNRGIVGSALLGVDGDLVNRRLQHRPDGGDRQTMLTHEPGALSFAWLLMPSMLPATEPLPKPPLALATLCVLSSWERRGGSRLGPRIRVGLRRSGSEGRFRRGGCREAPRRRSASWPQFAYAAQSFLRGAAAPRNRRQGVTWVR